GSGIDGAQLTFCAFLEPLDLAEGNVPRVAPIKFLFGLQFVYGLLVIALGLLKLTFGLCNVHPGKRHLGVKLRKLATRSLDGSFLLRAVEPEDWIALFDGTAVADENLGHAPVRFRKDWDSPEE